MSSIVISSAVDFVEGLLLTEVTSSLRPSPDDRPETSSPVISGSLSSQPEVTRTRSTRPSV